MQNTRNLDGLASALLDLMSFLNSPQRDEAMLRMAGVELDRALFPLLMRLGMLGPLGVAELAEQVGRDHTTVSRQLAKMESLDLIERCEDGEDKRRRAARVTAAGKKIVAAITKTRRRALDGALAEWSASDRTALERLTRKFADSLIAFADKSSS